MGLASCPVESLTTRSQACTDKASFIYLPIQQLRGKRVPSVGKNAGVPVSEERFVFIFNVICDILAVTNGGQVGKSKGPD